MYTRSHQGPGEDLEASQLSIKGSGEHNSDLFSTLQKKFIFHIELIVNHYITSYFMSTTQRTQSPCFICSNELLMDDSGSRWVMNSSTMSWPLR